MFENNKIVKFCKQAPIVKAVVKLNLELTKLGPIPDNTVKKIVKNPWDNTEIEINVPKDTLLYDYIVDFFNVIVNFYNSNDMKFLKKNQKCLKYADSLIAHLQSIMNSGLLLHAEKITNNRDDIAENIILGGIFGLYKHDISYWKYSIFSKRADFYQWVIQIQQLQKFLNKNFYLLKDDIANILIMNNNFAINYVINKTRTNFTK